MKVAIYSESPADESALRILVNAILGVETESYEFAWLRSRGWPSVRDNFTAILRHLYYHTDAEAVVAVVDSDNSPIHTPLDDERALCDPKCRLCQLRQIAERVKRDASPIHNRAWLKLAIGIAIPSIEAWYLCGQKHSCSETAWLERRSRGILAPSETRRLKKIAYNTERPSVAIETQWVESQAQRIAGNVESLERFFPNGFGPLASDLRGW